MKQTIIRLTKNYAGINYSKMDQIMPIILDKENIPSDALEDHSHVAIGNATADSCILSSSLCIMKPTFVELTKIYASINYLRWSKTCQLYWTKKISHQMHMEIRAMLELTPRPQQAVHLPNHKHFVIILC